MTGFFMFLFVVLSIFLVLFILIQQGKGDMGLSSLGRSSQALFGGSGGQDFFEKTTWVMGFLFLIGALSLTIWKTKESEVSRLADYRAPITQPLATQPNSEQQASGQPATQQQEAPQDTPQDATQATAPVK